MVRLLGYGGIALEAVMLSQSQQQGSSRRFGCGAMAGGPWNGLFWGAAGAVELSGASVGSWDAAMCSSLMLLREFQQLAGNIPAAAVPLVESGASVSQKEATAVAPAPAAGAHGEEEAMKDESGEEQGGGGVVEINFVKELEQLLQSLEARRQRSAQRPGTSISGDDAAPFAGFFPFLQYSMRAVAAPENAPVDATTHHTAEAEDASGSKPSAGPTWRRPWSRATPTCGCCPGRATCWRGLGWARCREESPPPPVREQRVGGRTRGRR